MGFDLAEDAPYSVSDVLAAPPSAYRSTDSCFAPWSADDRLMDLRGTAFAAVWERYLHLSHLDVDARPASELACFLHDVEVLQQMYVSNDTMSAGDWPLGALTLVVDEMLYALQHALCVRLSVALRVLSKALRWKRNQAIVLRLHDGSGIACLFAPMTQLLQTLLEVCFVGSSALWQQWADVDVAMPDILSPSVAAWSAGPSDACLSALDDVHHEWTDYYFDSKKPTPMGFLHHAFHALPPLLAFERLVLESLLVVVAATRAADLTSRMVVSPWIPLQLDMLGLVGALLCVHRSTSFSAPIPGDALLPALFDVLLLEAKQPSGSAQRMAQETSLTSMVLRVGLEVCASAESLWLVFAEKLSLVGSPLRWLLDTSLQLAATSTIEPRSGCDIPTYALTLHSDLFADVGKAKGNRVLCYACQRHTARWIATGLVTACGAQRIETLTPAHHVWHHANLCYKALFDTLFLTFATPAVVFLDTAMPVDLRASPIAAYLEQTILVALDWSRAARRHVGGVSVELHAVCFLRHAFHLHPQSTVVASALRDADAWSFLWRHPGLFDALAPNCAASHILWLGDVAATIAELDKGPRRSFVVYHAVVVATLLRIVHALPDKTAYLALVLKSLVATTDENDAWFRFTMLSVLEQLAKAEGAAFDAFFLAHVPLFARLLGPMDGSDASSLARRTSLRFLYVFVTPSRAVDVLDVELTMRCGLLPALFQLLHDPSCVPFVLQMLPGLLHAGLELLYARHVAAVSAEVLHATLFQLYTQSLSELISQTRNGVGDVVMALVDILHTVLLSSRYFKSAQTLFRECGLFVHLTNLLHSRHYVETPSHGSVIRAVGAVLTLLMAGNRESKAEFRSLLGSAIDDHDRVAYAPLVHVCLAAEPDAISLATMELFLDMMVDNDRMGSRIHNPDAVPVLWILFRHCSLDVQHVVVHRFLELFDSTTYAVLNRSMCCYVQPATLDQILDVLEGDVVFDGLLQVMVEIGLHSIGVKQLKRFFRLLQKPSMAPHAASLVHALYRMVTPKRAGPSRFFFLDGVQSGLEVAPTFTLPSRGYTLHTWIRLEEAPSRKKQSLVSIRDENGDGYHLYVQSGVLCYALPQELVVHTNVPLVPHAWHCISWSHASGSFRSRPEASVCLDGDVVWSTNDVPSIELAAVASCHIGCDVGVTHLGRLQLGAVYLFRRALSRENVRLLHRRGPDMLLARPDPLLDELLWSYHPSVWEGQFFLNGSLHFQEATPRQLAARRLEGTYHVYTRYLVDVLDCIGGIAVVLPLLALFDFEPSPDLTANVLQLLTALQHDHSANQRFLHEGHGVRVVAYLLSRMAPQHRTRQVLDAMTALLLDAPRPVQGLIIKHWLGNFYLWSFAPLDVQLYAVATLRRLVLSPSLPWQTHLTVRKLLDDLRLHYWFTPPTAIWASEGGCMDASAGVLSPSHFEKGAMFNRREWCHPETHAPVASHLSAAECHRVRGALLELLETLLRTKTSLEAADVNALTGFLAFSGDDLQKKDVLTVLLRLFAEPTLAPTLAALIEKEVRRQVNTPDANLDPHYCVTPWSGFGLPISAADAVVALVLRRPQLSGRLKLLGLEIVVQCLSVLPVEAPAHHRPHSVSMPSTVLATALAFKPRMAASHNDVRFASHLRRMSSYSFSELSDDEVGDVPATTPTTETPSDAVGHVLAALAFVPVDAYDDVVELCWRLLVNDRRHVVVPALFAAMPRASLATCLDVFRGLDQQLRLLQLVCHHRVLRSWILVLQRCDHDDDRQVVLNVVVTWSVHCIATAIDGWVTVHRCLALLDATISPPSLADAMRQRYLTQLLLRLRHMDVPSRLQAHGSKWQYVSSDPVDAERQQWLLVHANVWHLVFVVEDDRCRAAPPTVALVEALLHLLRRMDMLYWTAFPIELETAQPWTARKGGVLRALLRLLLPLKHAAPLLHEYLFHDQCPHARGDAQRYILRALAVVSGLSKAESQGDWRQTTLDLARRHKALLQLRFLDLQQSSSTSPTPSSEPVATALLAELQSVLQLPSLEWADWDILVPPYDPMTDDSDHWAAEMASERLQTVARETLAGVHWELLARQCHRHRYTSKTMDDILRSAMQWERSVWKLTSDKYEKQRVHASHTWQRLLRSLTNERASWGDDGSRVGVAVQWKLDSAENTRRERCKLKRYYARDATPTAWTELPTISQADAQLSLATELLQAKALAAYNEDFYEKLKMRDEAASEHTPLVALTDGIDPGARIATFECAWIAKTKHEPCHLHMYPMYLSLVVRATSKQIKWPLPGLLHVEHRRFQFRSSALELFFRDGASIFVNFLDKKAAALLQQTLRFMQPPALQPSLGRTPRARFEHASAMQRWVDRKLSNFEYLMHLNTMAGRTYNDLAQYPIFPWVLADYTSETLDLSNPATFRNLSRPIGVQNDASLAFFTERYNEDDMPQLPPFHYGTHYSCSAFVIGFLLRLQPFTSYHKQLQGGKLDHADRLFHSIEASFRSCTTNPSDVRELIPEFYYLPEFLLNTNRIELGIKQNGDVVDNVVLPPWAHGSAHEFIRLHRAALESDYVSAHLHEWIDLIFGYKQRPPLFGGTAHAVDACNVYFHLTYDGALRRTPSFVLYGHDDGVTSVAVSSDMDLVLSASRDGTIIVHTLSNGRYIRTLRPDASRHARLTYVGLSTYGSILTYCDSSSTLYRYSINGDCLASRFVDQKAQAFALTQDGDAILLGGRGQTITVYRVHDLSIQREFDGSDETRGLKAFQSPIHALCFSSNDMHLLVGLGNGDVCVYTPDAQYLRDRLQTKLTDLGF
ncbi:hypothetical protein SPRG_22262 [Saprolegnia parasitica CBS 223.65]|uniref:BEACH domain-containing protein n=1 Tax=Saprolegnia parasitica (strain CBS 223.65) TaxID=695850 RepID=A0A067C4T0_SAPPC|nr:hypothetical protein SPRG_22262 [Saprolegnia parasitica CBS 223.65]KDO24135.1 hypothetical protein SPRG_22262 [Saprolegnia parasitica CBS 223.65]|eukprot:XP_012205161.1 hypothetical protein SPRG_22262 [Saprolegnia parasitica CBS 223.65]